MSGATAPAGRQHQGCRLADLRRRVVRVLGMGDWDRVPRAQQLLAQCLQLLPAAAPAAAPRELSCAPGPGDAALHTVVGSVEAVGSGTVLVPSLQVDLRWTVAELKQVILARWPAFAPPQSSPGDNNNGGAAARWEGAGGPAAPVQRNVRLFLGHGGPELFDLTMCEAVPCAADSVSLAPLNGSISGGSGGWGGGEQDTSAPPPEQPPRQHISTPLASGFVLTLLCFDVKRLGDNPSKMLTGANSAVTCLQWMPAAGRPFIAAGDGGRPIRVYLWDTAAAATNAGGGVAARATLVHDTASSGGVWSLAWSPDGSTIATGVSSPVGDVCPITLFDATRPPHAQLATLASHRGTVLGLDWHPHGTPRLLSVGADGTAKLWDTSALQELETFKLHSQWAGSVRWAPDGVRMAAGGAGKEVQVWNVATRQLEARLRVDAIFDALAWHPDNRRLVVATRHGRVDVWQVVAAAGDDSGGGGGSRGAGAAGGDDGDGGSGGSVCLQTTLVRDRRDDDGRGVVYQAVSWHPDGVRLALGLENDGFQVWDTVRGVELEVHHPTHGVYDLAWDPSGRRLAVAGGPLGGKHVYLWE